MPSPEFHTATVAELLSLSRRAHDRYRTSLPRVEQGRRVPGDAAAARLAIEEAQTYRLAADAQDLGHSDPAWQEDAIPHSELLIFFAATLRNLR